MTTRAKANAPATRATTRTTRATAQASAPPTFTRTTRTTTKVPPAKAPGTTQPSTTRKPLVDRDNTADTKVPINKKPAATRLPTTKVKAVTIPVDNDREPIKAFLRLRPHVNADGPTTAPYLQTLSDTSVFMSDPRHEPPVRGATHSLIRQSVSAPPSTYTFSHVFPASTQQSEFFTKTTLPLVRGLLDGESGLLFAYGVTNSGKTHTMQGGMTEGSAGILPRSLDVVFNSIDGLQSNSRYKPVRLYGVELADGPPTLAPLLEELSLPSNEPVFAEVLAEHLEASTASDIDIDPTALSVDRNHEYSVWISYAEVYNEKIYDLLADVSEPGNATSAQSLLLSRKALPIRPSPPSDSPDGISGKYISGIQQVRVNSAAEAKKLVKFGQLQRRVFGTLANSQSSRSHGMVTIKILRKHRGEKDEPSAYHTTRLTLIDLAGSERTKHTQTTGDRLKEAGNINKSLMVLGQCMEVMRSNQRRIAQSLAGPKNERSDTRDVKKTLAVVPFRHSKLTEILMDYFVGDGRAVMIVNVNPYDTGFDENSHVMKFAALAKEIQTPAPTQRIPPTPSKLSQVTASSIPVPQRAGGAFGHHMRKITLSTGGQGGRKISQTQVEVLEEDEDPDGSNDEDYDDEPPNALVEALFDELENMRLQLFDAEMRCAIIEADTREEVMQEMEQRIENMEKMFARRLMNEVEQNEMKMDAKIDMLHQSGLFGKTPGKARRVIQDIEEEEDVAMSIVEEDSEDESIYPPSSADISRSNTASPLAQKGKRVKSKFQQGRVSEVIPMPASSGVEHSYLASDDEGTETESRASEDVEEGDDEDSEDSTEEAQEAEEEEDTETEVFSEDAQTESDGDWQPEQEVVSKTSEAQSKAKTSLASSSSTSSRSYLAKNEGEFFTTPPSPVFATDAKTQNMRKRTSRSSGRKVSELAQDLERLGLSEDADISSSTTANQSRRSTRSSGTKRSSRAKGLDTTAEERDEFGADDSAILVPAKPADTGRSESLKKKKRQLGSKPVVTEDQIELAVGKIAQSDSGKSIRRMTRASK